MTAEAAAPAAWAKVPPTVTLILRVFTAVGAVLLVAALVLVAREAMILSRSERSIATVSRIETAWMGSSDRYNSGRSTSGNTGYRVVATFRASDGHLIEVRSPSITSATSYRVGDRIAVNYPAGRPEQAQLSRFVDRWMLPLVLGAIGAVALGICALATWMLHQPGTRIVGNGMGGFLITPGVSVTSDDPAAQPGPTPAPEDTRSSRRGSFTPLWLLVVLALGITIGVFASSRRAANEGATTAAIAAPSAQPATPAPGYPPNLTVDPPAMSDPQASKSTVAGLTMAARAFVAQPVQDAAMQAELRRKVAQLGLDCSGIVFTPGETLLLASPRPVFDPTGKMTRGLIRQRFTAVNCPGRSPEYNVWVLAAGDGTPVRTVAGFPGTTRADLFLLRDATPIALGIAGRLAPGCADLTVSDTHVTADATATADERWSEQWLVIGCGKRIALTINFIPDPARRITRIEVPFEMARLLPGS